MKEVIMNWKVCVIVGFISVNVAVDLLDYHIQPRLEDIPKIVITSSAGAPNYLQYVLHCHVSAHA